MRTIPLSFFRSIENGTIIPELSLVLFLFRYYNPGTETEAIRRERIRPETLLISGGMLNDARKPHGINITQAVLSTDERETGSADWNNHNLSISQKTQLPISENRRTLFCYRRSNRWMAHEPDKKQQVKSKHRQVRITLPKCRSATAGLFLWNKTTRTTMRDNNALFPRYIFLKK